VDNKDTLIETGACGDMLEYKIDWFNPATFLCLSQATIWI